LGFLLVLDKQHDAGLEELEKAVTLDPNFSWGYAMLAAGLNLSGRPEEAIGFVKKAMRLDPNSDGWVVYPLAHSYYLLRRYDDAIAVAQEVIRRDTDYLPAYSLLAIVYAELNQRDEAQAQALEVLRISPGFSVDALGSRGRAPYKNQADLDRAKAALRKAGLK
jgi:tetratricopeptide (TPR) repeat protein